jgi:hypothetical protein
MIDQLQFQLSQLAYSLENFTEKDQIDYLSEYWERETNLKELEDKSVIIRKFSEYFIQRVSHTLKDKEKILRRNPFAVSLNGRVLPVRPLGYNKRK